MGPVRGKRKRRESFKTQDPTSSPQGDRERLEEAQQIFRQHFETTFAPLPELLSPRDSDGDLNRKTLDDQDSITDWEGLSDSESDSAEVVQYGNSTVREQERPRHEHKIFMSSKPPQLQNFDGVALKKPGHVEEEEDSETDHANLKKDLALQRLLQESHLLERDGSTSHGGETRHRAVDMRFQKLGSKSSIYAQTKMPLAQRMGIATKAAERLEHRRREARENGIVLEKARNEKKNGRKTRQRTIDAPSVGKFRKGMLTLSKKDLYEIRGPRHKPRR